jgi:anthranilate synthase
MNRTAFSLPEHSEYRTSGGLAISRAVEQFTGNAKRLDDLIELLDRRRGVVLSSGTTVPGRYESFDLGFADPPLVLETAGSNFSLSALNARGEVLIAFLGDVLREPCVVISEKSPTRLAGHIIRGAAPVEEDQRTRRASVMSLVRDLVAALSPMTIRCSACSARSPTTSYSRSRTSCRSGRGRATSATSCCMCRIACWPMTAPPAAAWC